MDVDLQSIGIQTVQEALEKGSLIFNEQTKTDDFNRACDHILVLLADAFQCFERGSWGTSVFLSITAIEEVAKAEVGLYRREGKMEKAKRSQDKLFNHQEKHRMAISPTVFMGKRLEEALGKERCAELLKEAAHGEFRNLRESSLYFSNDNGQFVTPANVVSQNRAKEFLLLALEAADDRLVGYTNHTGILEARINEIFSVVAHS
ncbi:AbiV family abortive infection protein [Pseudomonas sp. ALS1131]|nr:AbiV family abortive infection protein [Pseudomonas sp. ALS1131]TRO32603.1 AbiV family abortive infection protein [Pseudomonas sp. ALS1131]